MEKMFPTHLTSPEKFVVEVLPGTTLPAASRPALVEWQRKAAELQRSLEGASSVLSDANNTVKYLREAIFSVAKPNQDFVTDVRGLESKLKQLSDRLNGDGVAGRLDIDKPPSISQRLNSAIGDGFGTTSDPTATMKEQLQIAGEEFEKALADLRTIVDKDIKALEQKLEAAGAPYTPGRMPELKKTGN